MVELALEYSDIFSAVELQLDAKPENANGSDVVKLQNSVNQLAGTARIASFFINE